MPEQTAPAAASILENDMGKYTAEQVLYAAQLEEDTYDGDLIIVQYLRDYAALLRERESAKAAVTYDMINAAMLAYNVACHSQGDMSNAGYTGMRAALEAVAPMLASARVPDEYADAFKDVLASLVASVSLLRNGGRKAAASDKMFSMMLNDYEKAITRGRSILLAAAPKPEEK